MRSEIEIIDNELQREQRKLMERFEDWKTEPVETGGDYHERALYKLRTEIDGKLKFEDIYQLEIVLSSGELLSVDDETLKQKIRTELGGQKILTVDDIYIPNHMRDLSGELYVYLESDGKMKIYKKGVHRPESVTEIVPDQIDELRWKRKGKKWTDEKIEDGVSLRSRSELFYALDLAAESDKDVFLVDDFGEEWKLLKVEVDEGPSLTLEEVSPKYGGKPTIMREMLHYFDDMKVTIR